ncbi:hypothetical protein IKP94_04940 [Candidatus Saccharibacteria bacterium]|nr:hypothetical protein [Candidatus Saccharibacteria bacterium]
MSLRRFFSINSFIKLICSLPVVLVVLYFVPVLGVIMLIARYFIYGNKHFYRAPIVLIILGLLCLLPRGIDAAIHSFNLSFSVPYLSEILSYELYPKFADFGKFIFILGVVALIVSYLLRSLINTVSSKISRAVGEYASVKQQEEFEIRKENDLKMREKEITSAQKTPHAVKCPHCGKTNSIIGTVGKCKSCRSAIEWHAKK